MVHKLLVGTVVLLASMALSRPAEAGPPFLCHVFDTGSVQSLPWDGASWNSGRADYDIDRLVADTQALLTPAMPVIARMETLRRAAVYASRNRSVAEHLMAALQRRANATASDARAAAIALFDAGYLAEAIEEHGHLPPGTFRWPSQDLGGIVAAGHGASLIRRSLALQPDEAGIEFALAMISTGAARDGYARRAKAAIARDNLIARNLHYIS